MRWFGPSAEIEIERRADGVRVKVRGEMHFVELLFAGAFVCMCIFFSWRHPSWFGIVFSIVCSISAVRHLVRDREGELWATENYVEAKGSRGGNEKGEIRLFWSEISSLEFRPAGEDSISGLFAQRGRWDWTCLIADLNREQCDEIVSAVYGHFPYLKMADVPGGWSLFEGSELTTLGLSARKINSDKEN